MSSIANFAEFKLTPSQQSTASRLEAFLKSRDQSIFIVKGFAGTGKTSLMKALAKYASNEGYAPILLASTGRAASILQQKTGRETSTIHSHIYTMADMENLETKGFIYFYLKPNFAVNNLYIVDEASLISNHENNTGLVRYGSGRLLSDILEYVNLKNNKIVFVGDAAQLPPVNSNISPALDEVNFLRFFGIQVPAMALEEVMRFPKNSGIYQNTNRLRQVIMGNLSPYQFYISASSHPQEIITYPLDSLMLDEFTKLFRKNGPESTIFIAYSNAKVNMLNLEARRRLDFKSNPLTKSECLVVSANNHLYGLNNGDQVTVLEMGQKSETRAGLHFREVSLLRNDINGARQIKGLMIEEILTSDKPMLPPEAEKALVQDFMIRMSIQGLNPKKNKKEIRDHLMTDPYLNALRLRYGYALTCHKAQGGEWDDVFIILERSLFHPNNIGMLYRWIYTALTRAAKRLHLLENPMIR